MPFISFVRPTRLYNFDGSKIKNYTTIPAGTQIKLSKYVLDGLKNTFMNIKKLMPTAWIIAPVYYTKDEIPIPMDTQLAVTGSIADDETPESAALWESREEIGILCDLSNLIKISTITTRDKKTVHNYMINVSNAFPFISTTEMIYDRGKDDYSNKVQIVFYGSFRDVCKLVEKIVERAGPIDAPDITNIRGLRVLPITTIVP